MKTCLIVGNGLSFNDMPKGVLESAPTFGMNYCGFQPTYYVCVDSDVLEKHFDEIRPFVDGAKIAYISGLVDISKYYVGRDTVPFVQLVAKDLQSFKAEQYMSGFTSAYVALKCAYYLGYNDVHLWGIDHSLDWTHYIADYPAGAKDRARRMAVMEFHYQLAASVYARAGRTIINHSAPSKLDKIFRRAS